MFNRIAWYLFSLIPEDRQTVVIKRMTRAVIALGVLALLVWMYVVFRYGEYVQYKSMVQQNRVHTTIHLVPQST
jgi:hypothetical protein